mgnify:FL=1
MQEEKNKGGESQDIRNKVLFKLVKGRTILNKSYPQLNGRTIVGAIDDWTKRWNGYIPAQSSLLDADQSNMFLNFTRNEVIHYLSNVALRRPKTKVKAVNKKTGSFDPKFSKVCNDLIDFSSNEENGDARFLENSMQATIEGTIVAYDGYAKNTQKMKIPQSFDVETGKIKVKEENRVVFDNCFQKVVPVEDFLIANPYQPSVQKQPWVIWREVTTYDEASCEFGDYKGLDTVKKGNYQIGQDAVAFYRSHLETDLAEDGVEIIRFYEKYNNLHVVMANGVVLYEGPIPFKDGRYPFAKGIFEPFDTKFFWGAGFPNKIMGEQDLINTFWNMMADKTYGSLLPFGLSSDLDDWIEDDTLSLNRIRKVGDINKWKFDTLPGVSAGEHSMLQTAMNFARENAGTVGGGPAMTSRGGKLNVRQVLLQQQEAMKKIGFSASFMEDMEQERNELRLNHILQFYSIPKIEKITGKQGTEIQQFLYRDVRLEGVKLSDGKTGNKYIKLIDKPNNEDERQSIADDLSVQEAMGDVNGVPTEALAVAVDTFYDYNLSVQVIKASSFSENAALDQASRMEFSNWRIPLAAGGVDPKTGQPIQPVAPADVAKIVSWVEESFDIDQDQFKPESAQPNPMQMMGQPTQGTNPLQQIQPSSMPNLSNLMG